MATQTDKLEIRLIQPSEYFADDAFNEVIKDIDNKVVGVSHLTSGAHWSVWEKSTDYVVGDVVRTHYLKSNQYMECVVAGTSSTTSPTTNIQGSNVTDNTVTWTIKTLGGASDSTVSFWKSNTQYYKGSLVVYNNKLYRSYFTHISSTFSNDKANWFEIQSSINTWTANAYYAIGDTVVYEGNMYQCNTENTDATFTVANWNLLNSYGIVKDWSASTKYFKDQLISYDGAIYKVKSTYTSGNSFSDTNLSLVSSTIPTWSSNTYYPVGIIIQSGNVMYKCTSAHTSSNAFNTDLANWEIFHTPNAFVRYWQANTEYKAGQLVVVNGNLYRRTSDGYDTIWSTDFWELVTNSITDWSANTNYTRGQYVNYNGALYKCIKDHIAQPAFQNDTGNWQKIYSNLEAWTSNTQYFVNDVVTYNNALYGCKTKTNKTTFDPTEWEPILTNIKDWASNTNYIVGQLVINDSKLYECTVANTSSTTFVADTTKWKEISASIPEITMWVPFKDYTVDNLVLYNNNLYSCTTAHTSTQLFTETYWQIISAGSGLNTWKSGSQYLVDNVVVYNNRIYKCKTQNNDSAFTVANWTAIVCDSVTNWESNTLYQPNTFVMADGALYICLTANTSSDYFIDDTAYWLKIYSSASCGYEQISRLSITAPVYIDAEINKTSTFLTSPVEVLKLAPGDSGVTENQFTFSVGDGSKFTLNGVTASNSRFLIFDDTVRQNHDVAYAFSAPVKMVTNYYAESEEIDLSDFKLVNGVKIR